MEDSPPHGGDSTRGVAALLPISNKLENLFFEIHSCMRDIDGLHADAALEELCKLLYVKIHDEELVHPRIHAQHNHFSRRMWRQDRRGKG